MEKLETSLQVYVKSLLMELQYLWGTQRFRNCYLQSYGSFPTENMCHGHGRLQRKQPVVYIIHGFLKGVCASVFYI